MEAQLLTDKEYVSYLKGLIKEANENDDAALCYSVGALQLFALEKIKKDTLIINNPFLG